jgi:hypothetical protein
MRRQGYEYPYNILHHSYHLPSPEEVHVSHASVSGEPRACLYLDQVKLVPKPGGGVLCCIGAGCVGYVRLCYVGFGGWCVCFWDGDVYVVWARLPRCALSFGLSCGNSVWKFSMRNQRFIAEYTAFVRKLFVECSVWRYCTH